MKLMTAEEFLIKKQMTPEDIGSKLETIFKFLQFYDDDKVIEALCKLYGEKIIQMIIDKRVKELTRRLGEESAVRWFAQMIGEERWRQITEQLFPKKPDNNDD